MRPAPARSCQGRVGRAEVMGLAVSLVSRHKEKVWYYDRRKWEGKQLSTKLATEGGCCIWYDEPSLFTGVQKRLGAQPAPSSTYHAPSPPYHAPA